MNDSFSTLRRISDIDPFRKLNADDRTRLAADFRSASFQAGEHLVFQNRTIASVGLIEEGRAEMVIERVGGEKKVIGSAGKGDFFGVTCFLKKAVSPFSIVCVQPIDCWVQESRAFLEMMEAYPLVREHFFLVALGQMAEALQGINGAAAKKPGGQKRKTPRQRKLEKAIRYIDKNYFKPIRLEDAAVKSGMSQFHFSRVFKSETGCSFKEYLTRRRIEAVKAMLLRGEGIAAAAQKNGFQNPSYFTQVFRRLQGMTPTEYLKMLE